MKKFLNNIQSFLVLRIVLIKFNNLVLKLAHYFGWKSIPVYPTSLDIEPINYCNLRCARCQINYWEKEKSKLEIPQYLKILDQFPKISYVKLQGIGEPFLNNNLIEFILINESRNIHSEIITNGTLLPDNLCENISLMRKTTFKFSIDSAFKSNFEIIRAGAKYEEIILNLKKIIALRGPKSKPEISMWSVITKNNLNELCDLVNLAANLKFDNITFQTFLNDWRNKEVEKYVNKNRVDIYSTEFIVAIDSAIDFAKTIDFDLRIESSNYCSLSNKCRWPFVSLFIAVNGDIVPCCVLSNSSIIKMGNIFENNIKEIWNSKKYKDLRNSIFTHHLKDYCKKCYGTD